MRIVIDLQGAQTESRFRGVGRYSLAIASALATFNGAHDVFVLLNSALPESMAGLRQHFATLLPPEHIRVFNGLTRVRGRDAANSWRQGAGALLREAFIAALEPDAVFIPGFIEGYIDDAVVSVSTHFPVPTVITLHDLIPQLNPEKYLDQDPRFKAFYTEKVAHLQRASALAAVSESAAQEAITLLDYDPSRISDTSEAADDLFRPLALDSLTLRVARARFGITKPFVLYAGSGDPRKNLERLVQAFGMLPQSVRQAHQLVLAGRMGDGEQATLRLQAARHGIDPADLIFLGYVPDPDLAILYNDCAVFAMPSLHEGFGLPALEAMQCGAPTIGSNTSSLPEVIGLPEALFDPLSVNGIAEKLTLVLTEPAFRSRLIEHGLAHSAKFSWAASAARVIALIERVAGQPMSARNWDQWPQFMDGLEQRVLGALGSLELSTSATDGDWQDVAQVIADNRVALDAYKRVQQLPDRQSWRLEGPFDSSYSLALVNRELARALVADGHSVELHSAEGYGSLVTDPKFLRREIALAPLFNTGPLNKPVDVMARNMYPPRVADMGGRSNILHNYAWEETGFPTEWVDHFNDYLQGLTVTSTHVKKLLIDAGVRAPIVVVGNGIDHWDRVSDAGSYALDAKGFRFLHVSSGFPRKGLDALLAAYAAGFTSADDVSLVIKTFANEHNTAAAQVAALKDAYPNLADIVLIEADLDDASLKALYAQCHVMVAPSRAEGFGLPLAEALLSGLSVIATGWSGQLDFLQDDRSSLIDFEFVPANSHLPVFDSVWAEPSIGDLTRLMQEAVREAPPTRAARVARHQEKLRGEFSWQRVARTSSAALAAIAASPVGPPPSIAWVSTFAARCGIATYSKHLIDTLLAPVRIHAAHDSENQSAEGYHFARCWHQSGADLSELTQSVLSDPARVVVLQFNYGFFNFRALRSFLRAVHDSGRVLVVELHATIDPLHDPSKRLSDLLPELALCDRILVHSVGDLNRLKALGLVDNVTLFPHGVLDTRLPAAPVKREPIIASYGFFLPNKGLLELIEAFAILRREGFKGKLRMVNAQFPVAVSDALVQQARKLIRDLDLRNAVELHTRFLSDEESLALLAPASLVVFPYQKTAESSSGAVRYGIASRLPVATTPLPIFDDVSPAVFKLPGTTPQLLAQGIGDLLKRLTDNDVETRAALEQAAAWRDAHLYSRLGRRLTGLLHALERDQGRLSVQ